MKTIKNFEAFNEAKEFKMKVNRTKQGEMKKLKDQAKFDKKDDKVMEGSNASVLDTETVNSLVNDLGDIIKLSTDDKISEIANKMIATITALETKS